MVKKEVWSLDSGRSELAQLTREECGYLKGLYMDEQGLYREFLLGGEAEA